MRRTAPPFATTTETYADLEFSTSRRDDASFTETVAGGCA